MKLLLFKSTFLTLLFLAPCRVVEGQAFVLNPIGVICSDAALVIYDAQECLDASREVLGDSSLSFSSFFTLAAAGDGYCGCQLKNNDAYYRYACTHGQGTTNLGSFAPICRAPAAPPAADGGGDPHYSMFSKQFVTVQALCDLNLFSLKNAYGGVQIHSRHSMPLLKKEKKKGYSVISNLAIRIGNDTWELIANGPNLFRNGIYFDGFEDNHEKKPAFSPAGGTYDAKDLHGSTHYSVQKFVKGQRKNIVEYVFTFPDNNSTNKVVFRGNHHYKMNFVEVHGFASHSVQGFLGRTDKKGFFDRRGKDMMSQEESHLLRGNNDHTRFSIELYAQEWQVGLDEMNLFMNKSEDPVAPQKCSFLGKGSIDGLVDSDIVDAGNNLTIMGEEARPRRKLLEVDEKVVAMATKACAHLSDDNPKKKFCLEDVMVTQEPELALDSFYEK